MYTRKRLLSGLVCGCTSRILNRNSFKIILVFYDFWNGDKLTWFTADERFVVAILVGGYCQIKIKGFELSLGSRLYIFNVIPVLLETRWAGLWIDLLQKKGFYSWVWLVGCRFLTSFFSYGFIRIYISWLYGLPWCKTYILRATYSKTKGLKPSIGGKKMYNCVVHFDVPTVFKCVFVSFSFLAWLMLIKCLIPILFFNWFELYIFLLLLKNKINVHVLQITNFHWDEKESTLCHILLNFFFYKKSCVDLIDWEIDLSGDDDVIRLLWNLSKPLASLLSWEQLNDWLCCCILSSHSLSLHYVLLYLYQISLMLARQYI